MPFRSISQEVIGDPGQAADQDPFAIAGGGSVPLIFSASNPNETGTTASPFSSISGLGLSLNALGQSLTGDFTFGHATDGGLLLGLANAQLSLSDGNGNVSARGPPILQLTNGTGQLEVTRAGGLIGGVGGSVALNLPSVSLTGTFDLLLNTTGNTVNQTFTTNGATAAGDYTLFVKADGHGPLFGNGTNTDAGSVIETNDANNTKTSPVTLIRYRFAK